MARTQRQYWSHIQPELLTERSGRRPRGFSLQVSLSYGCGVVVAGTPGPSLNEEFVRIRPALERYLRARGAGDDTEDLAQELWLKIATLSTDGDVSDHASYLYRMAHNLMLDRHRAAFRRSVREHQYSEFGDGFLDGHDQTPTPERQLDGRRSLQAMQLLLRSLGERTDYIFRRHRIDGIGQREIASELGITLSAVEKHLQKAYKAVHAARRTGGEHDTA